MDVLLNYLQRMRPICHNLYSHKDFKIFNIKGDKEVLKSLLLF